MRRHPVALAWALALASCAHPGRGEGQLPTSENEVWPGEPALYQDDTLGLEARLPRGFDALQAKPGETLVLRRTGLQPAVAAMLFIRDVESDASHDRLFLATAGALALQLGQGHTIREVDRRQVQLAVGQAEERTFEVSDVRFRLRVTLVPVCEAASGLLLVTTWTDEGGKSQTEAWVKSFSRSTEHPPICRRKVM